MLADIPAEAFSLFTTKVQGPLRAVVRRAGGWSYGDHANGQAVEQNEIIVLKSLQDKLLKHAYVRLLEDGERVVTCKECKRIFLECGLTVHVNRVHGGKAR